MRPALLALALALLLSAGAGAQAWTGHDSRDLSPGWALDTPPDWISIPEVKDGLGWRSPEGKAGVIVTFVPRLPPNELEALKTRGFEQSKTRLAGHDATLYTRNGTQRFTYLTLPQGTLRLAMFGTLADAGTLDRIALSFHLVSGPASATKWAVYRTPEYCLSYPADWQARQNDGAVEFLTKDGKPALRLTTRSDPSEGQSFRGYARSLGSRTIPKASSLERFEPLTTDAGATGYLAVWKTTDDLLVGPVAYLPLGGARAVEALLLDGQQSDTFFRIARSFQPGT